MSHKPHLSRRLGGAAAGVVLCVAMLPAQQSQAAPAAPTAEPRAAQAKGEKPGNYDSRRNATTQQVIAARGAQLAAKPKAGVTTLRGQLGIQGIVDMDPVTGTARRVAKIDGFLTATSTSAPAQIALDYVRARQDVFGLDATALGNLRLRQDYVDIEGTHHLSFIQSVNGVPVFGNGLKAHVAKDGRLIQVDGSPVGSLPASFGAPALTAAQARDKAVGDVFGTSRAAAVAQSGVDRKTDFAGGDRAQLVVFQGLGGARLAWQTITLREGYIHVVDAATGEVLWRQSTMADDSGLAWANYPGAPTPGGTQERRAFTDTTWLPQNSTTLNGNVAHVWTDVNDDDIANPGEEIAPSSPTKFHFPFVDFTAAASDRTGCSAAFPCSWDPDVPNSWRTNANQNATQLFFFLGRFHDHLSLAPIGFTRSAGNFEAADGDAVEGNALDGANIAGGLPDSDHVDNANMNTPPDGMSPRMQMYLFHDPSDPTDPFIAGNSGDEAGIVYHEYTHGLSNRLVVDASGISTLNSVQAGAMGEAWSDWYAMDLLVKRGLEVDGAVEGDLLVGKYVTNGTTIRSQPLDCQVGSTSPACPGTPTAGPGGYTYGDFGRVRAGTEVHADGEIWAATLWDLRKAIGSNNAEGLVTRAMELSPANPSFLDMRNSILQADLIQSGGFRQKRIWEVFAHRGMGFFAGSLDGGDVSPVEDFTMPPPANTPRGTLTGVVRDSATGTPVVGALVAFGGHTSGFAGDYAGTTDATGTYTITGIIPGTYPKVSAQGGGFDPLVQTVSVASRVTTVNWSLRRDWAALAGGGEVVDFNGIDLTPFGCGPPSMFDQSQGQGWSTDAVLTGPVEIESRFVTLELPVAVEVSEILVNPSATCGDAGSASTGDYSLETSQDGTTWTTVSSGHFGLGDRSYHAVPLSGGTSGVRFVRYTMIGTQVADLGGTCPGNFSGCSFVDSVELGVYGEPTV